MEKYKYKKYPFSKKALQAMLAATIAFTPVVTGAVIAQPVQVEAANFSSAENLVGYLDSVYDQLDIDDKDALDSARDQLSSINWDSYASQILSSKVPEENKDEAKQLLTALLNLFYSTNVSELNENIADFRDSQGQNVDTVFGEDVTVDNVLTFLEDFESEYLKILKNSDLDSESDIFWDFISAMNNATGGNFPSSNATVADGFFDVIDEYEALDVLVNVTTTVDPDGDARAALINALEIVVPEDNGGSGGSGGSGGDTTTPGDEDQDSPENEVDLPEDSTETEKDGDTLVTKILPEKAADIAKLITAEKAVVPIKLAKGEMGEKVRASVPAALFTEAAAKNGKAVVAVQTEEASYNLPVSEINVPELAKTLGVAASEVEISISVNVVEASEVEQTVSKNNLNLASNVVEFTVEASSGDKKESISKFSVYVERNIVGEKEFDESKAVAVKFNEDGSFASVPTLINGKNAKIKSLTNSKYAVVENEITFPDVTAKNWGQEYIETLASKYVVEGYETGKYLPNGDMTRAEFTVLLVRALGLPGVEYNNSFKDVKGTEWYNENGELMAAIDNGIIEGMGNNLFAPNAKITRAQAAVMIERAMDLGFLNYDKSQLDSTKKVSEFKDANQVADWAYNGVKAVYQAGIVSGHENGTFEPNGHTTREQMAKILAEFLISADLMNDTIND